MTTFLTILVYYTVISLLVSLGSFIQTQLDRVVYLTGENPWRNFLSCFFLWPLGLLLALATTLREYQIEKEE